MKFGLCLGCGLFSVVKGEATEKTGGKPTMKAERTIDFMANITPVQRKIIDLVTAGKKPGTIARKTGLHKRAVERHIEQINGIIREVACNV